MRYLFPAVTTGILLGLASPAVLAQSTNGIIGRVQTDSGEPLPGATIFIKDTYLGGTTNSEGDFRLDLPKKGTQPLIINVSFLGYETQVDTLQDLTQRALITLIPSPAALNEIVVSASRVEERSLTAPSTIDKLNAVQLGRLTQTDLIPGLARLKGVDVTQSGIFMSSASTRGFNGATSERLVQLVDMMDTQSPSLNINSGNALGLPEVDIASVEILHGPSSALYGANAFNGVLLTTSKNPFSDPGLSVRLRGGSRDYLDGQLRYALRLGQKVAVKVVGSYARANEWVANNMDALSATYAPGNNPAGSGLGYDAVNRYGDVGNTFGATGGALAGKTVFMPGWSEQELIRQDRVATLYRVIPSISYLITDGVKAMVEYKIAQGTTAYQFTNRYRLKDFGTNQLRAEITSDKWYVRAYQTKDFGGSTYDLPFTGTFMQTAIDPRFNTNRSYAQEYFGQYALTYNTYLAQNRGDVAGAEKAALAAAAPFQLAAGSPEFNALRNSVINDNTPGRGSLVNPSSFLNDVSGQYSFKTLVADIVVGGAYRQYRLGSNGKLFADTEGKRLVNHEYGGYLQLQRSLLQDRLKLTFAGRMDDAKNFKPVFSPRGSVVYSAGSTRQHNVRANYNQAYRSPTQQGQYLQLDLARVYLLGNVSNGFQGYNTAVASRLGSILASPATAQAALDAYAVNYDRLKPERVSTWEVGYKGLLRENLVLDVNYYNSTYRDFIGQVRLITNTDGSKPTVPQLATAAQSGAFQNASLPTRVVQIQANAAQEVKSSGSTAGLTYTPLKALSVTANYTLNLLDKKGLPEGFQTYFNTPKHKYNAGIYGELKKVITYSANYRWAKGHLFESPFAAGQLKNYASLDAQIGYLVPKIGTTFQLGGSNLANQRNIQVYGGPQIGRLVYAGLTATIK